MKRYVMECLGTFFLTLAISLTANPIAIGLMLLAMIAIGGHVSGAHCNPAVSLAFFLERHISGSTLLGYAAAQTLGACVALHFFMMITGNMFIPEMVPGALVSCAILIEGLCTMLFCSVILTMCLSAKYKNATMSGTVIGLSLMAIAFIGGLFNPAVAVASFMCNAVKTGYGCDPATFAVYVVSPLCGAFAAWGLYNYFKPQEIPYRTM
jgi:glycerol uptake facilitator-like aquaporin